MCMVEIRQDIKNLFNKHIDDKIGNTLEEEIYNYAMLFANTKHVQPDLNNNYFKVIYKDRVKTCYHWCLERHTNLRKYTNKEYKNVQETILKSAG